ncbi:hypothetical protein SAMN04489723_10847 [Algoriphagus aquimarinus]|uniref:Uncharacterized protein n=2 Tax=Algoriphagus aquimarinus TaxID=237018 RepID=A0A1I1AIK2_9BACT|nr:hypothetical protein SAMN04489723_10847 [Algoriphagus aquimarinus]
MNPSMVLEFIIDLSKYLMVYQTCYSMITYNITSAPTRVKIHTFVLWSNITFPSRSVSLILGMYVAHSWRLDIVITEH